MQAVPPTVKIEKPEEPETFENKERHFEFCGHRLQITQHLKTLGIPAVIWPSGLALCRYFDKVRMDFSGKKIIELGSGTGLVGILATLLGGEVTLTDLPKVLHQVEDNVLKNVPSALGKRAQVCALEWGKDEGMFPSDYDVVLGSDLIYHPRHFQSLIDTLLHVSSPHTIIYFSSNISANMGGRSFHQEIVPKYFNSEILDEITAKEIRIFKLTKKYDTN
ncbi:EEF1A lysine methyltransferase 3-like [Leucoraja erinacea]|uniref:EEF1A lysine methyltransferase 3-like n=1 Tax=Leucoraja erinaceus TaxID=7782 RepID=UPI002455145A|nr:EEF1A lysine methyltransferase 3-like [Leucoraja erinacea]